MLKLPAPDPGLDQFREGIFVLRRAGDGAGHVASVVGSFWSPSRPLARQWWVWFVVVWINGDRERPFEDYPPWTTVRELKTGTFTWDSGDTHNGEYTAERLAEGERVRAWSDLGLTPDDF